MRLGSRRDWAKAVAKPRVSLLSQVLMKQSKQPIVRPAGGPSLLPSPRPTKESRSGSGGQPWVLGRGGEEIAAIIEFLGGADQAGCVGAGPLGPRVTPAAASKAVELAGGGCRASRIRKRVQRRFCPATPCSHTFLGTPACPVLLLSLGPSPIHGDSFVDLGSTDPHYLGNISRATSLHLTSHIVRS